MWGAVFLLAVAGTPFADHDLVIFEDERVSSTRTVSRWEAAEGQFPHQLFLRMTNFSRVITNYRGTIISAECGLMANHCTAGRVIFVIRVGTFNLTALSYFDHPVYNEAVQGIIQPHDVSRLDFSRSLTFGAPPENLTWVYRTLISNYDCLVACGGSNIIAGSIRYSDPAEFTFQDDRGPLITVGDRSALTQFQVTSLVSRLGCHVDYSSRGPAHYHDWFLQVARTVFAWKYYPITIQHNLITAAALEESSESFESSKFTESSESSVSAKSSKSTESTESLGSAESLESAESSGSDDSSGSAELSESAESSRSAASSESSESSKSSELSESSGSPTESSATSESSESSDSSATAETSEATESSELAKSSQFNETEETGATAIEEENDKISNS